MSSIIAPSAFIGLNEHLQAVRRSRKRAAVEESLHAPAVKRLHIIALPWVIPMDAAMNSSPSESSPALTPTPKPSSPVPSESAPDFTLTADVSASPIPSVKRRVVDLADLLSSSTVVASPFASIKRTQKLLFRATDREVKRESSYDYLLDGSSRDPSPSSEDSQMSERDMDVIDSKRHACPECGKWMGSRSSMRRTHYIQCHYDVYFSIIDHMKTESWLGRRLGSWTETNWKCVNTDQNGVVENKWKPTPATRVCIYCKHTESQDRLYGGRADLLRHIGKAHPVVCRDIMRGYREKARRGEYTTKFSWAGMVKNEELHALLISSPFALTTTTMPESIKEIEIITID